MNDEPVIEKYLNTIDIQPYYVDIGCSNKFNISYSKIINSKYTVFIEADKQKYNFYDNKKFKIDNFQAINNFATPDNVLDLLKNLEHIGFLDLDIDGYDYFVLEKILTKYQPDLLCCEINEKIPWPIKFTVLYNEAYQWDVSHFYGMSLAKLHELVNNNYILINLTGNNAYYVNKNINCDYENIDPEYAYKNFYDPNNFSHNHNVNRWLSMNPDQAIEDINKYFTKYRGLYEVYK
jgi:hypothetical protein|tara:strand:- start:1744 stop:2448 length:705 start_codon:yes stop_codon:yes gene_type:complete